MRIGVIGGGVTGRATARTWLEHADEVRVWDIAKERQTHSFADTMNCDLIFVCLPEGAVAQFFSEVTTWERYRSLPSTVNFVLRSTVPIGTTRRLAEKYGLKNLVHSPEFLTARCAMTDAQVPARNIIGVPKGSDDAWNSHAMLVNLYRKRFPGVPCLVMLSDESEAVKLMTNAFFAAKVSLFNEFRALTDKLNLDWGTVRDGILSDGRIAHSHTQVPGPDGKRGFGGFCLPKDLEQLIGCYFDSHVSPEMLVAVKRRNDMDRKVDRT